MDHSGVVESGDLEAFEAMKAYDWDGDQEFQIGLREVLSSAPPAEHDALALKAKCFYFSRQTGLPINPESFQHHIRPHSPSPPPGDIVDGPNAVTTASAPRRTGPAMPVDTTAGRLTLDEVPREEDGAVRGLGMTNEDVGVRNTGAENSAGATGVDEISTGGAPGAAQNPVSFSEIVELITSGKPIPGIKEIPNLLSDEQPTESTREQRRKPWESADRQANLPLADGAGQ